MRINDSTWSQRDRVQFKSSYPHKLARTEIETHYSARNVLCVSFRGRIGNVMFQYASGFGIAKLKNMTLRISIHDRIAHIYNTSAQKVHRRQYCKFAFKKFEKSHCAFDENLSNFSQSYIKLYDYLQSWKYFASVVRELRQEFRFNDLVRLEAELVFHKAARSAMFYGMNATFVGVHIRRGDMFLAQINNESQVSGYNIAPVTYIENAMRYYKTRFHRVIFVVCSDDIRWVIWQFGRYQKLLNLVFIHRKPEVDLAVLGMCNHTVMTTGTFGWWAGWLAGGTTVYYKHYVKETSALRSQFSADFSDYFYPGWIPME